MKKKYLLILLFLFIPQIVLAAPSATIDTSSSSIENGKTVTVTVTLFDTAAWNIKIEGSGAASCSQKQSDVTSDGKSTTKKFDLSCTSTEEGIIVFTVTGDITSESGETTDVSLTKNVTVTKAKSSDNSLKELKVDGVTVSGFSSSNSSYSLGDTTSSSIDITAIANDSNASVSGTGSKTLNYGKNSFTVTVTAENGSQKQYTLTINKKDTRSTNNYLKSLSIDKGSIEFDKNNTSYSLKLEHNINEITIYATAEDDKSTLTGTGKKELQDYVNKFTIDVTAENGETKSYTIIINRQDADGHYGELSTDNSVKSISVSNYNINFSNETKKYNILVDEDVNTLDITVEPNDSKATVNITGNTDLKPGLNVVKVQVIAENEDINEFLFNVYKIGEQKENDGTVGEKTEKGGSIWLIISIIEFIIIVGLSVFQFIKMKQSNKNNNDDIDNNIDNNIDSNDDVNNVTNEVDNKSDLDTNIEDN